MEKELNELVERLRAAAGANLRCVVLYGSAATGEFHPKHSDLNVMCVVEKLGAAELEKLNPVTSWWTHKGNPAPLVLPHKALLQSADVFPIELLDIKTGRRVLFGEDVFADLQVPMDLHRVQLERELRINLIRLRQSFLASPAKPRRLLELMTASISTFAALFRHVLIALGEEPPHGRREVVNRLAARLGFDATPFNTVLDLREGKRRAKDIDAGATFHSYLTGIMRVIEETDLRSNSAVRKS